MFASTNSLGIDCAALGVSLWCIPICSICSICSNILHFSHISLPIRFPSGGAHSTLLQTLTRSCCDSHPSRPPPWSDSRRQDGSIERLHDSRRANQRSAFEWRAPRWVSRAPWTTSLRHNALLTVGQGSRARTDGEMDLFLLFLAFSEVDDFFLPSLGPCFPPQRSVERQARAGATTWSTGASSDASRLHGLTASRGLPSRPRRGGARTTSTTTAGFGAGDERRGDVLGVVAACRVSTRSLIIAP